MYRAATWKAIHTGVDVEDGAGLTRMTESMRIILAQSNGVDRLIVDGTDVTDQLRDIDVDRNVSAVSAVRGVRRALTPHQRRIAEAGPTVMVGRDMGTVVLPDARTKAYLEASLHVRAKRRYAEMLASGNSIELEQVVAGTERRDRLDSSNALLRVADDALVIQTDGLTLHEVVERVVNLVERP
jgi:cytidylate kinase